MKHLFKATIVALIATVSIISLSSFINVEKENKTSVASYQINLESKILVGTGEQWTWSVSNPNPGNGTGGTLQDVSHWSVSLNYQAEAALVSAEYSFDGITWMSVSAVMDRDPAIRQCCTSDVLKFDVGTTGTQATYYRATFDAHFETNAYSTSWIKTGGGLKGCNVYCFPGPAGQKLD